MTEYVPRPVGHGSPKQAHPAHQIGPTEIIEHSSRYIWLQG